MSDSILLTDEQLTIVCLTISNRDAIGFLRQVPEIEREAVVAKALEVGLFCLERGRNTQDLDYVKRQVQELLQKVESTVSGVPGTTERALLGKLGTENGQVLAPVKALIEASSVAAKSRIDEVKELLANDLDPKSGTSTLGVALSKITTLLDAKHGDSVQSAVTKALSSVADADGAIALTMKRCVEDSVRPLKEEIDSLSRQLSGAKMVEDALANTPGKGKTFEELVAEGLGNWAKSSGGRVERVGEDNQPGDFIIEFYDDASGALSLRVVIEARDRQTPHGRQKITQDLAPKFRHRNAHAAIHVSKTTAGLAKEIGDWAEGHCDGGPWVACTHEQLTLALRFVVVEHKIRKLREARPDVDTSVIYAQSQAIRTSLGRIKTIKSKVTNLRTTTTDIENEAESLKADISGALATIEEALRQEKKPPVGATSNGFTEKPVIESLAS